MLEIENPVGFDSRYAYECDNLIEWLRIMPRNPITSEYFARDARFVDILQALVVDNNDTHMQATQIRLTRAWMICGMVNFFLLSLVNCP